jgi:PGF-CTERM protein
MYKMGLSNVPALSCIALVLAIAVILAMPATAAEVSVTRDLPDAVTPGAEFEVSVNQSGFYVTGFVTEQLPEGFSYRGVLSGGKLFEYDEATNNLTIDFNAGGTVLTYLVKAGTEEQIKNAVFSGTWTTVDSQMNIVSGSIAGDTTLKLAGPTPTPTPTITPTPTPPSGGGGGGGGGGPPPTIPPTPPAEALPYLDLHATPAEIPADGASTSTITAFVWNGDEWVMENLTVKFSTSLGEITASAPVVNGSATGILTAGTTTGAANVTAEANLSGEVGVVTNTTTVTLTKPSVTPTPTPVVTPTPTITPTGTPGPTQSPSPSPKKGLPGFEAVFAIAGLLAVAYLVLRKRKA